MEFYYKKINKCADERRDYCNTIKILHPNKIPIILERDPKSMLKDIDKTRYLIPDDLTINQFSLMIRIRGAFSKETPLFLLVNGTEYVSEDIALSELYDKYKDYQDGFLYMAYTDKIDLI